MQNRIIRLIQMVWCIGIFIGPLYSASESDDIAVSFDGGYGQLEIGGKYVGAGFHNSFPLPSRISFYYPLANSIDLSSDYWHRGYESHPFSILLSIDGITESIGSKAWEYSWAPYFAHFSVAEEMYSASIDYRFAEDLPVMIMRITVHNNTKEIKEFKIFSSLSVSVRASHSFTLNDRAVLQFTDKTSFVVGYPDQDTDSTAVFVLNAGSTPVNWSAAGIQLLSDDSKILKQPRALYEYVEMLDPGEKIEIIQIIGSCKMDEWEEIIEAALSNWEHSVTVYENRVMNYALDPVFVLDQEHHMQTLRWSRALLQTNLHYLDGEYVPMPCPAEYNFYFTHDMLLTNLGTVMFDVERVRSDLLFLHSLTDDTNILPHAYYWKDDRYTTEFAGSDNWNHLWFIILLNSYMLHSGDEETSVLLYPIAEKSLDLILENYRDGLMYASRPDWWDIGDIYGARAYLTILTIRAIDSFASLATMLDMDATELQSYLNKATVMRKKLVERLWDDDAGYLLNMLNEHTIDRHLYAGSLLAAVFNILDKERMHLLLKTAQNELIDEKIGLRIAMPADFHKLIDIYAFQGMEAGAAYQYLNGGVWPHGNAWYALGLLAAGLPDEAESVVRKFMTINGIMDSPRGQPSFFEYRNADPTSVRYGEIDKPAFLWAGGWYLHVMYRLAGVRDNGWNISFNPNIPHSFNPVTYSFWNKGQLTTVNSSGNGNYFKNIMHDGQKVHSTVLSRGVATISLERGIPEEPYLREANCIIEDVQFDREQSEINILLRGINEQRVQLSVVSPFEFAQVKGKGIKIVDNDIQDDDGVYSIELMVHFDESDGSITILFR